MDIDYFTLFLNSFITASQMLVAAFGTAFAANPWPFLGVGALLVVAAATPARRTRRRRRA